MSEEVKVFSKRERPAISAKIFPKFRGGQVTIFIILALVVVVMGVMVYMFWPQIKSTVGIAPSSPYEFIQTCLQEDMQNAVDKISNQGGSVNPEYYYLYENTKLEYLCYTNEYYKTCAVQQPLLVAHIESEIKKEIEQKAKTCFADLKASYEKQGFTVNMNQGNLNVQLLPKKVVADFNYNLVLKKEASETFNSFKVVLNNNLYELANIAKSITDFEATYGDSETTTYMDYYPEMKIEKKKQSDGTKIYIITERETEAKFQFASRSLAWPGGYGIQTE
jgi:flagellar basal body-associated protein FliL